VPSGARSSIHDRTPPSLHEAVGAHAPSTSESDIAVAMRAGHDEHKPDA
jgi:hypothetical protein